MEIWKMKVCVTMKLIIHANFESDTPKFWKQSIIKGKL